MLLTLAGDAMLGRLVNEFILAHGPEYPLHGVEKFFREADFSLVNLECQIARSGEPFPGRAFYFRAHPTAADTLRRAKISCASLANNHMMDFGAAALKETIKNLDRAGIAHAGAGANIVAAQRPAVADAGSIKIGVVSFADHFQEYGATEGKPGINYTEITTKGKHFARIGKIVAEARKQAGILIFSIHWGPNMRQRPARHFVEFAHAVMDLGVDIYHGHSAHLFQGIEVYNGKPVFYDTGGLVDDYYVGPGEANDQQLLFQLRFDGQEISSIELIPAYINMCQASPAKDEAFDAIFRRIRELSSEFGTNIVRHGRRLKVEL